MEIFGCSKVPLLTNQNLKLTFAPYAPTFLLKLIRDTCKVPGKEKQFMIALKSVKLTEPMLLSAKSEIRRLSNQST